MRNQRIIEARIFSQVGGRDHNEDYVFPPVGTPKPDQALFIVCDGVGGAQKGEVASRICANTIAAYFEENVYDQIPKGFIQLSVNAAFKELNSYSQKNTESLGMATTLALLYFDVDTAFVAHIGDSRVYHFRKEQILHQSFDHSFVNDLLRAGIINDEQAKTHPKRNVISRALQSGTPSPPKVEVHQIRDIQKNDYFFICSDGVLENITDFEIGRILASPASFNEKAGLIEKRCQENPNDNFSGILLQVKRFKQAKGADETFEAEIIPDDPKHNFDELPATKKKWWKL